VSKSKVILVAVVAIVGSLVAVFIYNNLASNTPAVIVHSINQRSDSDVTTSPNYNFSSFAGTVCKTKTRTAIAEFKNYKRKLSLDLLPPQFFDTNDPKYTLVYPTRLVAFLPVGTRIRIDHLMEDNGARGGVNVFGIVLDGTNAQTQVLLGRDFFGPNVFLHIGQSSSITWDVNTNWLERL
jgi:hypothetical protein